MVTPRVQTCNNIFGSFFKKIKFVDLFIFAIFGLSGSVLCYVFSHFATTGPMLFLLMLISFMFFGYIALPITKIYKSKLNIIILLFSTLLSLITINHATWQYFDLTHLPLSFNLMTILAVTIFIYRIAKAIVDLIRDTLDKRVNKIFWIINTLLFTAILFSYINMIGNSIFVPNNLIFEHRVPYPYACLLWNPEPTQSLNILGLIIAIIALIYTIKGKDANLQKLTISWMMFGLILIGIIKWGIYESPLFSYYFAWALLTQLDGTTRLFVHKNNGLKSFMRS